MTEEETPRFDGGSGSKAATSGTRASMSALEALRAEAQREIEPEPLRLDVPNRPNWGMSFVPDIDMDMVERWTKRSERGPKGNRTIDAAKFARFVILATHREFLYRPESDPEGEWRTVTDDSDERPLLFNDDEILDMLGAATPDAAVTAWYQSDGHVIQTAGEIMMAAGYGDDDVNPLMAQ